MKLSKKIKSIRKTECYTQKEFSKIMKVTDISIQNYENERSKPKTEFIEKICELFPEYAYWLMTDEIDPPKHIDPFIKDETKIQINKR